MLTEFRDFILRGKVGELAVAVLIGAAFSSLVGSLTKDIINPVIARILGRPDLSALIVTLFGARIAYGNFLNALISFLLVLGVVFFLIVTPLGYLLKKFAVPPMFGTKACPFCFSLIPNPATYCGCCTRPVEAILEVDPA